MSGRKILRRFSSSISDLLSLQRKNSHEETESGTALHNAVQMGNAVMAKSLLENRLVWIDEEDGKGRTALHYAVEHSNLELSSLLLACGANADCVDFCGTSACHLVARDGAIDLFDLLMYYKADACAVDKSGKTPFDLACEFGKEKMIERFFDSGIPTGNLINAGLQHSASALHLAARMGHVQIVQKLLGRGWNINCTTSAGTALHEAASSGKTQVVRYLLHAGIDTSLANSSGLTAVEYAKKHQNRNPITYKEIRYLLKESHKFVYAEAIKEYIGVRADELTFSVGDIVWVTERGNERDQRWKGAIFGHKANSRAGHFTPETVRVIDKPQQGMSLPRMPKRQRDDTFPESGDLFKCATLRLNRKNPATIRRHSVMNMSRPMGSLSSQNGGVQQQRQAKKVSVPVVPNMAIVNKVTDERNRNKSAASYRSHASPTRSSENQSQDSRNGNRNQRPHYLDMHSNSHLLYANEAHLMGKSMMGMSFASPGNLAEPSHRNSTGSNSSQGSSGFESMKSSAVTSASPSSSSFHTSSLTPSSNLDSPPSRTSVHSSGSAGSGPSSLASCSVDTLDDSSYGSFVDQSINVTAMVAKGVPEAEIVALWLDRLGMSEYLSLFLTQGYDLSSIARITPEDLCALGITSPTHRKKLMGEIHSWQITDSWPAVPPPGGLRGWLTALALPEYLRVFEAQGYDSVQEVMKLTWEDFEDIGINRLGQLKRLGLAIKKLKDNRRGAQCGGMEMSSVCVKSSHPSVAAAPVMGRARPSDPPPPAPPSTFQNRTSASSNIDYLSYARGNYKQAPPPPIRSEEYSIDGRRSAKGKYDSLFETSDPIKLNLVPAGRILSEASRGDVDSIFSSSCLPVGADCPPPPAPLFCEGSIRRLQSVVTSVPSTSNSSSSLDTIPFANENCGTIRHRDQIIRPTVQPTKEPMPILKNSTPRNVETPRSEEQNRGGGANVLNDIGYMLQNLTDELDAMLGPTKTPSGVATYSGN